MVSTLDPFEEALGILDIELISCTFKSSSDLAKIAHKSFAGYHMFLAILI